MKRQKPRTFVRQVLKVSFSMHERVKRDKKKYHKKKERQNVKIDIVSGF